MNTVMSIPLEEKPISISMEVYDQNDKLVHTGEPKSDGIYSGFYIYTATIPAKTLRPFGTYVCLFKVQLGTEEGIIVQKLECVDTWTMAKLADLRMMVDKVQKSIDLYTGYRDSDLYFHLRNGLLFLNSLATPTAWQLYEFKSSLKQMDWGLMQCSLHSLLRAQYLAEGDAAFDYSGQPVQLSIDRTSFIEAELGRLEQDIAENVKNLKKQFYNRSRGVGHLGLTTPTINPQMNPLLGQGQFGIPTKMPFFVTRR